MLFVLWIRTNLKKKPMVTSSERFVKNPLRMNFDKVQQTLVLGIRNITGQAFYDPAYFTAEAAIYTMQKQFNQTSKQNITDFIITGIQIRRCSLDDIKVDKLKSFFSQIELNEFLCFGDEKEIFIEGDISYDYSTRIEIALKQCQNSTKPNSIVCASQEEIDSQLSYSHLVTYYIDKIIDPTNLDNPFTYEGSHLHSIVSNKQGKQVSLNFANYYIQTDVGLVYEEIEYIRDHRFVSQQETVSFESPQCIVRIVIQCLENKEFVYDRGYMKIQDFVTQIGGVLKLITFIGSLLTYPFVNFHLNKEIVNNLFDFETEQNHNQNQSYQQYESKSNPNIQDQSQNIYHTNEITITQHNSGCQLQNIYKKQKQSQSIQPNLMNSIKKQIRLLPEKSKLENQNSNDNGQAQDIFRSQSDKSKFYTSRRFNSLSINQQQEEKQNAKIQSNSQILSFSPQKFTGMDVSNKEQINQLINTEENDNIDILFKNIKVNISQWIQQKLYPLKRVINYNTFEYIFHIFFPFSKYVQKKKPLLNKSIERVNSCLDIEYILKKFQEIDKLKQIVLNEDQIQLFDLLPRPLVQQDKQLNIVKIKSAYYNQDLSYKNKFNKVQASIENILNKDRKSEKDLRLIELIDTNLFYIISTQQLKNQKQVNQSVELETLFQNDQIIEQTDTSQDNKPTNSPNTIHKTQIQTKQSQEADIELSDETDKITNSQLKITMNYKKNQLYLRDKLI